jgi:hypothetical protein
MSALIKSSILLIPAIMIAVSLYILFGGEDFDAVRSQPHQDICQRDGDRLAQLQAKPSLDEAVRFGSELRCLTLWPQLQAILDSLTHTAGSPGVSGPNGATPPDASAVRAASPASSSPAMETISATSDEACKHDEDRLAALQAKPSLDSAMRFGSELRCSKLRPQLLAVLDGIDHTTESAEVSNDAPPDTSVGGDAPPAALPAMGLAGPSLPTSGGVSKGGGVETNATNEPPPATEVTADADRRIAALESERDALAAEVGWLTHHQDSISSGPPNSPASPRPAIPAERSDLEPSPASATLPDGMPARVLIRYLKDNADARQRAESLANALTAQGVQVADLHESAGAVRTELSFSYAPDEAIALRVGRLAGIGPVRRPQPKDGLMARPGTVELSLSGNGRLAVITTSRKESNHE